jgi:hypothetical protein
MALPMPREAPVIKTVLPAKCIVIDLQVKLGKDLIEVKAVIRNSTGKKKVFTIKNLVYYLYAGYCTGYIFEFTFSPVKSNILCHEQIMKKTRAKCFGTLKNTNVFWQ